MSEKLKVAMVTAYPKKDGVINGGVEGVSYNLVQGMKSKPELEISIIAPGDSKSTYIEQRDGITIHWIKKSFLPGFLSYWTIDRSRIHRLLKSIKPDVTHFQGLLGYTLGYNNKYISTIHGILEKDILFKGGLAKNVRRMVLVMVERVARARARNVIIINPYILDELKNQLPGKKWDIRNPINPDFFSIKRDSSSKNILYIGRISSLKNVLEIIKNFKGILNVVPDAKLRLVGRYEDKQYYDECVEYVKSNVLDKSVVFIGGLNQNQIMDEFKHASCLVLMSNQEVAPMVISEALASGIPIVARNVGGVKYMINNDVDGYLIEANDNDSFINKVVKLLTEYKINDSMGENARRNAHENYDIKHIVSSTIDAYKNIFSKV